MTTQPPSHEEVQRFKNRVTPDGDHLAEDPNGDWVDYADHRKVLESLLADNVRKDERIAALEKDAARTIPLLKALRSVRSLLDGMENWSNHDVYANARCAFSTADDAIEGDAALNPQCSGTAAGREG